MSGPFGLWFLGIRDCLNNEQALRVIGGNTVNKHASVLMIVVIAVVLCFDKPQLFQYNPHKSARLLGMAWSNKCLYIMLDCAGYKYLDVRIQNAALSCPL